MKTYAKILVVIFIIFIVGLLLWRFVPSISPAPTSPSPTPTSNQSISDGTIKIDYSSKDFALATSLDQVLVKSYIPPCDQDFNYCLYFTGNDYKGSNFESAGIRIKKRTDLVIEGLCLNTPPDGFTTMVPSGTKSGNTFSTSLFNNIGQGAAGHVSSGRLYRLFVKKSSTCYEFETRIGESQFVNYPVGSIKEFTNVDRDNLQTKLDDIIRNVTLDGFNLQF